MWKNYLVTALRTLRKHTLYSGLNVAGLAVGLACGAFILLYVVEELSYDRFHDHADRIVRVVEDQQAEDRVHRMATTFGPLAPALEADLPAVEQTVRVFPYDVLVGRDATRRYQEPGFTFVDSTFFSVFAFPLVQGDPATALGEPFSVVLTEATAARYFGRESPLGQTLRVKDDEETYDFTVTGVAADPPSNTHLRFDLLASFSTLRTIYPWVAHPRNWHHPPLYTYALLRGGSRLDDVAAQLPALAARHMLDDAEGRSLHLQPITDIRLRSDREAELTSGSSVIYVVLFALIGVFILLLAGINFVNLATARAMDRAREVGLRKAIGAERRQLVGQFLGESALLIGLAFGIALLLVLTLLPSFNALAGKTLTLDALGRGPVVLGLLGMAGVMVLGSGSYPAFYLSRFRPIRVLRDARSAPGSSAARFRKGLITFQFAVSIVLIVGAGVILRQLDFVQEQRLGFNKEHVVLVPLRDFANQLDYLPLKEAWRQLPGVVAVTASSGMPGLGGGLHEERVYPTQAARDSLTIQMLTVDHDYAETYGLEIVAGRDFSEDRATDVTSGFLLNESAARALGWDDAVGETLTLAYWLDADLLKEGTVVGVVRDFQYHSLHRAIEPLLFHIVPNSYYNDYVSARLHPDAMPETLAAMERAWAAYNPDRPFEYRFLDAQFDALYRSDLRLSRLFVVFAGLAVFIACLGLFGLAAFAAGQRRKEIGVRKVLGASIGSVVALLSADFLKLVALAYLVALPVAYLGARRWLDGFAERVSLGPGLFLLAGLVALAIALVTVSVHAVRAATADPVRSLRYE